MPTTAPAAQRRRRTPSARRDDEAPIIPILARKVREVEAKAQRGKLGPTNRVKFQVIAFLVREERARVKADTDDRRRRARRAAQAPGWRRDDPRQDRSPRHVAHPAARGRSGSIAGRAADAPRLAARVGRRAGSRRADHHGCRARRSLLSYPLRSPSARSCRRTIESRQLANPFLAARPEPARAEGDAAPPSRRLGAHGPPVQGFRDPVPAVRAPRWTCRRCPSSTASRPRASRSWCISRASSSPCARDTARSCSPTSRASARRRSRCSRHPSPMPTRCWPSCPTSSR